MSLFRRAAKRDAVEPDIIDALERLGWSVLQVSVANGPDLFAAKNYFNTCCGHQPRCVAIECKTGKRKLKPGQERFKATWAGEYVVLRSVEDVIALNQGE
jgi:Holliday junction resolvase